MADLTRLTAILSADISNLRKSMDDAAKIVKDASRQMQLDFTGAGKGATDLGNQITTQTQKIHTSLQQVVTGVNLIATASTQSASVASRAFSVFNISLGGVARSLQLFTSFRIAYTFEQFVESMFKTGVQMDRMRVNFTNFFGQTEGTKYFQANIDMANQYGRTIEYVNNEFKLLAQAIASRGGDLGRAQPALEDLLTVGRQLRLTNEELSHGFDVLIKALNRGQMPAYFLVRQFKDIAFASDSMRQALKEAGYVATGTDEELRKLGEVPVDLPLIQRFLDILKERVSENTDRTKNWSAEVTKLQNQWALLLDKMAQQGVIQSAITAVDLLAKGVVGLGNVLEKIHNSKSWEYFLDDLSTLFNFQQEFTKFNPNAPSGAPGSINYIPGAAPGPSALMGQFDIPVWSSKGAPSAAGFGDLGKYNAVQQQTLTNIRRWGEELNLSVEAIIHAAAMAAQESALGARPTSKAQEEAGVFGTLQVKPSTLRGAFPATYGKMTEEEVKKILQDPVEGLHASLELYAKYVRQTGGDLDKLNKLWYGSGVSKTGPRTAAEYGAQMATREATMRQALYGGAPGAAPSPAPAAGIEGIDLTKTLTDVAAAQTIANKVMADAKIPLEEQRKEWLNLADIMGGAAGEQLRRNVDNYDTSMEMIKRMTDAMVKDITSGTNKLTGQEWADRMKTAVQKVTPEVDKIVSKTKEWVTTHHVLDTAVNKSDSVLHKYEESVRALAVARKSGMITDDEYLKKFSEIRDAYARDSDEQGRLQEALAKSHDAIMSNIDARKESLEAEDARLRAQIAEKEGHYELAKQIEDEVVQHRNNKEAIELEHKEMERYNQMLADAKKYFGELTPEMQDFVKQLSDKASAEEQANLKGVQAMQARIAANQDKLKDMTTSWVDNVRSAAKQMEDAFSKGFVDIMEGQFGKLGTDFKKMIDEMVAKLLASKLFNLLFGESFMGGKGGPGGVLGGAVTGIAGLFGFKHQGGMGWEPSPRIARMHSGWAYPDEIPTLIKKDEMVLTPGQQQALAGFMGRHPEIRQSPNLTMNIHTPDVASFKQSQRQLIESAMRYMNRAVGRNRL